MNLQDKNKLLNNLRLGYLRVRSKLLSIAIILVILVFVAILIPLILLAIVVIYGLVFFWTSGFRRQYRNVRKQELKGKIIEGEARKDE